MGHPSAAYTNWFMGVLLVIATLLLPRCGNQSRARKQATIQSAHHAIARFEDTVMFADLGWTLHYCRGSD